MNFHVAVHRVFPDVILPVEPFGRYVELSGRLLTLSRTLTRKCEVLASGQFHDALNERQQSSYLVRIGELLLMFRACPNDFDSMSVQVTLR
jgi:class 3 adenylate cyclase